MGGEEYRNVQKDEQDGDSMDVHTHHKSTGSKEEEVLSAQSDVDHFGHLPEVYSQPDEDTDDYNHVGLVVTASRNS